MSERTGEGQLVAGRWRLERVLGEGATGRTWLARDEGADHGPGPPDSGPLVAVKELLPMRLRSWKDLELFEREAALLETLDHPGIPSFNAHLSELDDMPPRAWLVQEYIEGETLLARIERAPLTLGEVRDLAMQLLEILDWLHGLTPAVHHRDLKPANVMIRPDGRAVLIDFGAVREVVLDADRHGSTMVGTVGYMPPEQYAGRVTASSDLFALGATLVHALTGRPPEVHFDGTFAVRLPEQLGASVGMRAFIEALLAVDPEDRPRSAGEASDMLEDALLAEVPEERARLLPPDPGPTPRAMRLFRRPSDGRIAQRGLLTWTALGSLGLALVAAGATGTAALLGPGLAWTAVAGFEWAGHWRKFRPELARFRDHHGVLGEVQGLTRYHDRRTYFGDEALHIHYRFMHEGRLYRGSFASFADVVDALEPGDPIRILFDPDDPNDNVPWLG